jgi:hypothetical protein
MRSIVLNQDNIVPGSNNSKFQYDFPSTIEFSKDQVAVANVSLSVSWINIGVKYDNNFFQYVWYDNVGASTHNVLIPDGYYSISDLNAYLQFVMVNNGHYLVDNFGNFVYYLDIAVNSVYYGIELRSNPIPTALPGGWSNPTGLTFPAVATTPQFVIPSSGINTLLAIPAGTYPPVVQSTFYNIIGGTNAEITPVTNVIMLCSLLRNNIQYPNNIIFSFMPISPAGSQFQVSPSGAPLNISPNEYIFCDIDDGYYTRFEIQFVDQNYNPLIIGDPQIFIQMIFKRRDEIVMK